MPRASAAQLFSYLRLMRVMLVSSTFGPFVLMTLSMVADVSKWLVLFVFVLLGFASAVFALFSGAAPSDFESDLDHSCIEPDDDLSSWLNAVMLLWEGALEGEAYLECVRGSSRPKAGAALMYAFQVVVALLLVNMLIAMSARLRLHVPALLPFAFSHARPADAPMCDAALRSGQNL